MKLSSSLPSRSIAASALLATALILTGCEHLYYADPPAVTSGQPAGNDSAQTPPAVTPKPQRVKAPPPETQPIIPSEFTPVAVAPPPPVVPRPGAPIPPVAPPPPPDAPNSAFPANVIQVGDLLTVSFSDLPPPGLPEFKERVREDGNITLPLNITLKAAGKTTGQLQHEILTNYVPKYYIRLTATVKPEERFFFVGGEVRLSQRLPYLSQMTVLRAIQSAGDFTDFANRKKVQLIRANGQKHIINCIDAQKNPALDLPIYPNDKINVPRKWF